MAQTPDQTLAELRTTWVVAGGRPVYLPMLWRLLDEYGLRRKKSLHATKRSSERVRALLQQHVEAIAARTDVSRFHFLDETGLRLDYTRRYGRARDGRRVAGAAPLRQPNRSLTLIGALSVRGLHGVQVLKGALNQPSFALYVGRILAPQLRRGDVLVLDNLRVHHLTGLHE